MISRRTAGALLAVVGVWAVVPAALAQEPSAGRNDDSLQQSVLRVPANGNFPISKRVTIGQGKSMLVQFPFELKDVLVADPEKADAVVQSSNRVFLIAKGAGQTNAFFFDTKGQQILLRAGLPHLG
jgi:pilus assembly protein CpaC